MIAKFSVLALSASALLAGSASARPHVQGSDLFARAGNGSITTTNSTTTAPSSNSTVPSATNSTTSTNATTPTFQGNGYPTTCSAGTSGLNTLPNLSSCPTENVYSCENTTSIANKCCSPTPGGLVLITSFWSTYTGLEASGQLLPANSWTIHGLWPDYCNGSYTQYCDLTRQYDPKPSPNTTNALPNGTVVPPGPGGISKFLRQYGRYDLLSFMNKFWINQGDTNEVFWAHEFSKHATCFSTFDKDCYPKYQEGMDVVDFFAAAIRAHQRYPNYDILASHGITPSNATTYSLSQLQNAYLSQVGAVPYFGCNKDASGNKTILSEIWINAHVYGTPQLGQYKLINSTSPSSCVNTTGAIHYPTRSTGSEVSQYVL